eukprot:Nk52_evm13s295 gene=Nk52_evmTU13s295
MAQYFADVEEIMNQVPIPQDLEEDPEYVLRGENIGTFVKQPVAQGKTAYCHIVKSGANAYDFYLENHGEGKRHFLMSCRKVTLKKGGYYILSTHKDHVRKNDINYLGKIKGNMLGTKFVGSCFTPSKINTATDRPSRRESGVSSCSASSEESSEGSVSSGEDNRAGSGDDGAMGSPHQQQHEREGVHLRNLDAEMLRRACMVFPAATGNEGGVQGADQPSASAATEASERNQSPREVSVERRKSFQKKGNSGSGGQKILGEVCYSEVMGIKFKQNFLGMRGPRRVTVVIPGMSSSDVPLVCKPLSPEQSLLGMFKRMDRSLIVVLENKFPQWNDTINSYTLDFKGRVTLASVKNFQLVHPQDVNYVVFQMGKCGESIFTIDIQYPMTPLQAFLLAISSFHSKIACE